MSEVCTDNRFEVIAAYKKKLIESTNIETNPDEMAVIDNVLFRFWQLDWLPPVPHGRLIDGDKLNDYLKIAAIMADGEAKDAYIDARAEAKTMPTIIPAEEDE